MAHMDVPEPLPSIKTAFATSSAAREEGWLYFIPRPGTYCMRAGLAPYGELKTEPRVYDLGEYWFQVPKGDRVVYIG
jgi:hypothetical protein